MTPPYWTDDTVTIWHGDALALPLDDQSVDLVVTSPPYFALRSYTDDGAHYDGQLGSEPTPGEYVDALIAATTEMVRVLKPTGSIWVNLGDKYGGDPTPGGVASSGLAKQRGGSNPQVTATRQASRSVGRPKSLLGIPWRYALACIDRLGLILRAEIIWAKPNGLPESVTDRVRRSHEQWFHLVKQPRYYAAVDEIREPHAESSVARAHLPRKISAKYRGDVDELADTGAIETASYLGSPLGKLPGSVWTIPTQPLTVPEHLGVDHFAAFPLEWPLRIIKGWTPAGICQACGEGRRPITDTQREFGWMRATDGTRGGNRHQSGEVVGQRVTNRVLVAITNYACACPDTTAPTRPAVVLDPFAGTGTTGLAAKALGRRAHLVDLSADYCRLAQWRVTDSAEYARALHVDKPPAIPDGMDTLFDLEAHP